MTDVTGGWHRAGWDGSRVCDKDTEWRPHSVKGRLAQGTVERGLEVERALEVEWALEVAPESTSSGAAHSPLSVPYLS